MGSAKRQTAGRSDELGYETRLGGKTGIPRIANCWTGSLRSLRALALMVAVLIWSYTQVVGLICSVKKLHLYAVQVVEVLAWKGVRWWAELGGRKVGRRENR